ncbi:hypothetical protein QP933_09455 [Corynebacterium pseudodiphtheriticum]|uniref:hypothetical protein n=1 Tax=Corynebacterium pseudodiphtheriticum TaxID=37637 RepID=UPI00254A708C|nr:hypothetical protein [Corynebacterium pseudodiphtheriticum]MDK8501148.1 hypothetical protein [Corynebacterium pseudodiphtheriticum]MDK8840280.1 hypothetical protein [Corynebacterium pseudodiphtheriticum]
MDCVEVPVEAGDLSAATPALLAADPSAPVVLVEAVLVVLLVDVLLVVVSLLEVVLLDVAAVVVVEVPGCAELSELPPSEEQDTSASGKAALAASVTARVRKVRAEKMADTTTPGFGKTCNLWLRLL